MNNKNLLVAFIAIFSLCFQSLAQTVTAVTDQDFKMIVGCWQGTLTYLDYSTNAPYTMAADLNIMQVANSSKYTFSNIYPREPKANSSDTITLSPLGNKINEEMVTSRRTKEDGSLEIVTEISGIDGNDNKAAILRVTYTFGKDKYIRRKDVQFKGQSQWIKRHEYSYLRKPCN